jgi:predicted NACHT family NTPase
VSLLRYIAERISSRSPVPVTPAQLTTTWLGSWPWLLVLDGLDEVAAPTVREHITRNVSDFLVDAAGKRADVLIVVTTRPQGYAGEFGAEDYQRLDMQPLPADKAVECAKRLGQQRLGHDDDLREKVLQRVVDASRGRDTSRLLKTPLQVAIMQLLLERRQRAPHGRYQLFDAYFTAIYAREQNKPGWIGRLLEQHRSDIIAVHERIALQLQGKAESHGDREASVPMSVLADVTRSRLKEEGHEDDDPSENSRSSVMSRVWRRSRPVRGRTEMSAARSQRRAVFGSVPYRAPMAAVGSRSSR